MLLARFAGDHVAAGLEAARTGWRTVRVELADQLPPDAIEAAMVAYEREGTGWRPRPGGWRSWPARCAGNAGCPGCDGRDTPSCRDTPSLYDTERNEPRRAHVATFTHGPGRGGRGGGEVVEAWSELDLR